MDTEQYYLFSWNVERYTPKVHNWLKKFLEKNKPDVVFLSETKRSKEVLEKFFLEFENYSFVTNPHNPTHYHGVAFLIKKTRFFVEIETKMDILPRYDTKDISASKGRVISLFFENKYNLVGTYVPNSGKDINDVKFDYRINTWDEGLQKWLNECNKNNPTVWIGDINVCTMDLDISNPEYMSKFAGFFNEERISLLNFLSTEWFDIWRYQHLEERLYSWRGKKGDNTKYGMRLDNIIVSKSLILKVVDTFMINDCPLSDHVPICAIIK